jgi:large subunit ribosomal protein L31
VRDGIHPTYYHDAKVTCACGTTFETGSTRQTLRVDVCSQCHPFYTGQQRIIDTGGQVERFLRRQRRVDSTTPEQTADTAEK